MFVSKDQFFSDCYYLNLMINYDSVNNLLSDENILNLYKEGYDNYSILSAVILAKEVSIENKFVKILLSHGFIPTKKDKLLQKLEIYESIPIDMKNKILLFMQPSDILNELKLYIVKQWIKIYKTEFYII